MRIYLKEIRKIKKMTMKQIAEKLDISESYYCLIENGNRQVNLKMDMLVKLSETLGCGIDDLIKKERRSKK